MTIDQGWGGDWTERKLGILKGYLEAYLIALKNQPFRLGYIDAFAGAGYRIPRDPTPDLLAFADAPVDAYRAGSAQIALSLDPGFDAYVFIEQSAKKATELRALAAGHPDRQVRIEHGEANERIQELCARDWRSRRAVVFLDPFGMQVEWATLAALAGTGAVDVWILAPVAIAINRLLARDLASVPAGWRRRLDLFFGTDEWQTRLYETAADRAARVGLTADLFGSVPLDGAPTKTVGLEDISEYFRERLRTIFPHVAPQHRVLAHPNGQPLYALFFAAANPNPKAGAASLRIAGHLMSR